MARPFIGRKAELARLNSLRNKQSASFVVVRGRRRIGKSRLLMEFGKSMTCHLFTGRAPKKGTTKQDQIDAFTAQMSRLFGMPKLKTSDWGEVFWHLGKLVANGSVLLVLDEISWIGSKDKHFLGELKTAWDLHFSQNPHLILVVCGSISSWIEKNILNSTGFVGRISLNMCLDELPLEDAVEFWGACKDRTTAHEMFQVLAVTGGVPRYLEDIDPRLSAAENIRQLCFRPDGLLVNEFDQIFSDLFSANAARYEKILTDLADSPKTFQQLTTDTGIQREATLISYLRDLRQAGFIAEDTTLNLHEMKRSKLRKYRLSDNYTRFYLRAILPNQANIAEKLYASPNTAIPGLDGLVGLQFENLVLRNRIRLLEFLQIDPADVVGWGPFFQKPSLRAKGCQVDFLIQTRRRMIYLCEIKFHNRKLGIRVAEQLEHQRARIRMPKGWSTHSVVIHVNGVTSDLRESRSVDHFIDFARFLEK